MAKLLLSRVATFCVVALLSELLLLVYPFLCAVLGARSRVGDECDSPGVSQYGVGCSDSSLGSRRSVSERSGWVDVSSRIRHNSGVDFSLDRYGVCSCNLDPCVLNANPVV